MKLMMENSSDNPGVVCEVDILCTMWLVFLLTAIHFYSIFYFFKCFICYHVNVL